MRFRPPGHNAGEIRKRGGRIPLCAGTNGATQWEGATNFPVAIWFRGRSMIQLLGSSRVSGSGLLCSTKQPRRACVGNCPYKTDAGHLEEVAANEVGQGCNVHDDGSAPASQLVAFSTAIAARLVSPNVNM
jgi:hypothetical protein